MKKRKPTIFLAPSLQEIILDMEEIREKHGLHSLNALILLEAFLEDENSTLYNCISDSSITVHPYKNIIMECEQKLSQISKEEEQVATLRMSLNLGALGVRDIFVDEELEYIIRILITQINDEASEMEEDNSFIVTSDSFLGIFLYNVPRTALKILKNNGVFLEEVKEAYELFHDGNDEELEPVGSVTSVPYQIKSFVTNISDKYIGVKRCEILGRDSECKRIMRILQKRGKKNVIMIGEPGVGKTAIAEKIAFMIANNKCPEALKDHVVYQLDVNSIISGTSLRGQAEERFKQLVDFLETNEKVILVVDEIHMMLGAGATLGNDSGSMENALKPFLAGKKSKVIGATTAAEYERYLSRDEAFKRRFENIQVKEPKSNEVYPMLKNAIKAHAEFHEVKIRKEMVEYAILISGCFNATTHNPDRTNDLIDSAMVIAREKGYEYVTKECILEVFAINFEKFAKLSEAQKTSTAYHEVGHYLVWRKAGNLIDTKGTAISIMPADDYLGVTVFDDLSDEVTVHTDRDYFVSRLAVCLAGRVAEKMYTSSISSGASADLDNANKLAYNIITKCGLTEEGTNRIFVDDKAYHLMNDENLKMIDREVDEILKDAEERARKIIEDNKKLFLKIVKVLLQKSILDEKNLDRICKNE